MRQTDRPAMAALGSLIVLNLMLLAFLLAGVDPRPPVQTPLFGMGPFLAANLAAGMSAMVLGGPATRAGKVLSAVAILLALVSFGPHKLLDPALPLIWPALGTAWVAVGTLVLRLVPAAHPAPA